MYLLMGFPELLHLYPVPKQVRYHFPADMWVFSWYKVASSPLFNHVITLPLRETFWMTARTPTQLDQATTPHHEFHSDEICQLQRAVLLKQYQSKGRDI